MQKDLVFFRKEGEQGVALTSTSANYIANLAKEYIQSMESDLNNICFTDTTVGLINSDSKLIQSGISTDSLNDIPNILEKIAKAKSLIAWLREAIKAKENIGKEIESLSIENYCKEKGIEHPICPKQEPHLTEEEYYSSLSVSERNRYYQLETIAAVIGKYIHPDGILSETRKELKNKIRHPYSVVGTGRDTLVYHNTPTVTETDVDFVFFELQKRHREVQAQLNSIKHECDLAIDASINEVLSKFSAAHEEYKNEMNQITIDFMAWKETKRQEYRNLKIIIPHSLMEIYQNINSLGK